MHTGRGIGILVIFATIGEKENFPPPPLRAGRRKAYKEDARRAKKEKLQFQFEQKEICFTCDRFADKFVSIPCGLIVFDDCLLADCFDVELLNSGMTRLCCSH